MITANHLAGLVHLSVIAMRVETHEGIGRRAGGQGAGGQVICFPGAAHTFAGLPLNLPRSNEY